jgi:rubrerythrin
MSIACVAELYAHAIAIEREAAERYAELAKHMVDQGNDEVGMLFGWLAAVEGAHLDALLRRTDGVALPVLESHEYQWLEVGVPETAAREFVFRLMTPRNALVIALAAEVRALAFFQHVQGTAEDPGLRALAQEMTVEEAQHVAMVERLLERMPEPCLDQTVIFVPA